MLRYIPYEKYYIYIYIYSHQLLDGGKEGRYHKLVDQFYFEHHVHLHELARAWGRSMTGSIKKSLELFQGLRRQGIPAHYWP